jgi:hypothetical protein
MKKIKLVLVLFVSCLFLSVCNIVCAAGSWLNPFLQEQFVDLGMINSHVWIKSDAQKYDLTLGTIDEKGKKYANENAGVKRTFSKPLSYYGKSITSFNDPTTGPTIYTANPEVKAAWAQGWTGKGVNILNIDFYPSESGPTSGIDDKYHGIKTLMLIDQIAPGASKYGLNFKDIIQWQGCVSAADCSVSIASAKDIHGKDIKNEDMGKNIGVVNVSSFGTYFNAYEHMMEDAYVIANLLNDHVSGTGVSLSKAVIVSAAGNHTYFYDENMYSRLLLVGATKSDGTVSSKTDLVSDSNIAGDDPILASRFLVANGSAPYDIGDASISGANSSDMNNNANYASARVAGYAAILRHKFPNLSAEQASSLLLNTARMDTLVCYPNCPADKYGKGEASLSRALAPVGNLR